MKFSNEEINILNKLVGNITEENLKYVDSYISEKLSIFIPSVGFCEYAIQSNHTHPSYSFIIAFSEENLLIKPRIKFKEGYHYALAMSPNFSHEENTENGFTRYMAIFINKEFFEEIYKKYDKTINEYRWKQFLVPKEIMMYLKKFMAENEEKKNEYKEIQNALAFIITNEIVRALINSDIGCKVIKEETSIEKAINYMHQNFENKITVKKLANVCNMSESYFIKCFKEETGKSPIEYLINIRLNKARKLLRDSNLSITEISLKCGFYSNSHFSSCFLRKNKITPSKYRNLYSE